MYNIKHSFFLGGGIAIGSILRREIWLICATVYLRVTPSQIKWPSKTKYHELESTCGRNFYRTCQLNSCVEFIWIYPSVKIFFDTGPQRCTDDQFFYVIFIKRMYIKAKLKACIFRQKRSVHIRANMVYLKITKICFLRTVFFFLFFSTRRIRVQMAIFPGKFPRPRHASLACRDAWSAQPEGSAPQAKI